MPIDDRAFDDLPRLAPPAPDEIVERVREVVTTAADSADEVVDSGLTASAASADGHLSATVGERGLQSLDVGAAAMKLPSMDLADAITSVIRDAESAYSAAVLAAVAPSLPRMPTAADLAALEQLGRAGAAAPRQMQEMFDQFRRGAGF